MEFDVRQELFDRDSGEYENDSIAEYIKRLFNLFECSPEGRALIQEGNDSGWAELLVDYGIRYIGVTPSELNAGECHQVLFSVFPEKVSIEPEEVAEIIPSIRAFWSFMIREFGLANAADCLASLDDAIDERFQAEMANPANYGMAKSFMVEGRSRGFDLSTEEGLNTWLNLYNAEVAAEHSLPPIILPPLRFFDEKTLPKSQAIQAKRKRKMAQESRKKNRKRH